jgi:hypothetical protein
MLLLIDRVYTRNPTVTSVNAFFMPVSFISCASSASITWELTASRSGDRLFSSHLISEIDLGIARESLTVAIFRCSIFGLSLAAGNPEVTRFRTSAVHRVHVGLTPPLGSREQLRVGFSFRASLKDDAG